MNLFDTSERARTGPKRYSESTFAYYNESARTEVYQLREMLELWFNAFPDNGKEDLQARFRAPDDWQHYGAFFELYMHELVRGMGFEVVLHPPASEGLSTRPDFLLFKSGNPVCYLECTVVTSSQQERGRQARVDQVYDTLNRMDSPDFFLSIDVKGAPETPVPGRKLSDAISSWLSTLDWALLREKAELGNWDDFPTFRWSHEGWHLEFSPIPKSPETRGKSGIRPVGTTSSGMLVLDDHLSLRSAIVKKGRKYGRLDLPFIIGVNMLGDFVDDVDVGNALFGEEYFVCRRGTDGQFCSELRRKPNGAWIGKSGTQYTRISATLLARRLSPWDVTVSTPMLIHHPWPSKLFSPEEWPLVQRVFNPNTGEYDRREGCPPSTFLRTPNPWPPEKALF